MGILVPSLVLSLLVVCVTATKIYVLTWRSCQRETNQRADVALSWLLFLLNLLLLVFSILGIEIALEVLLSLANGALILYQCAWAWQFAFDYSQRIRRYIAATQVFFVITVCLLSPVLPSVLKEGHKAWHVAGLLFFAIEYILLLVFYCWIFFKSRKPKWESQHGEPEHQKKGKEEKEDRDKIRDILKGNIILSSIAFLAAIPSLVFYTKDLINFESSLWIKYAVAALWFLRWVLLQYTSKSNFKALWFWRWLPAINADSRMQSFTTNIPLREGSKAAFQSTRINSDSNTLSFATKPSASNEALCGFEVTLPSPVLQAMPSQQPFDPNPDDIQRNSGQGAGYMRSASLSSAATHEGWEWLRETASKRPPCKVTATSYMRRWRGSPRQRDPPNMKMEIARKRIYPWDTDIANTQRQDSVQGAAPELTGSDTDCAGDYPPCTCADSGGAPCHICGHLCCFTSIQGLYGSEYYM